MPAQAYRLLPPRKKRRRFWTAVFHTGKTARQQRSTGTATRRAARQWAVEWIREHSPPLCRRLGLKPLVKPATVPTPPLSQPTLPHL